MMKYQALHHEVSACTVHDNTLEAHHVRFGSSAVVSLMMLTADFRQATFHQAFRKTTIQPNEDTSRTPSLQDAAEPLSSEAAPLLRCDPGDIVHAVMYANHAAVQSVWHKL